MTAQADASPPAPPSRRRFRLLMPVVSAVVLVAAALLVEGFASAGLVVWDLLSSPPEPHSRRYVQHDPEIGWINSPGFGQADLFGPGRAVTINPQSFRGPVEAVPARRSGRPRVLCSGDSFTFGIGVGDAETWCAGLEARTPAVEAVNLGHAGYGIDQSYLWYRRAAAGLDHDVHVFAFIYDDFRRLGLERFIGYDRPHFRVDAGRLVLEGVPVPAPTRLRLWAVRRAGLFDQLRVIQLRDRLRPPAPAEPAGDGGPRLPATLDIALKVFEQVHRLGVERGVETVFVLLDQRAAVLRAADALGPRLSREAGARGWTFIDLRPDFRELPADALARMFDEEWGHYSAAGNRRVADILWRRLLGLGRVATRLAGS